VEMPVRLCELCSADQGNAACSARRSHSRGFHLRLCRRPSGIFISSSGGILAGVEVYGLVGDAPKELPEPEALRVFDVAHKVSE
jgi:hypothetical protein